MNKNSCHLIGTLAKLHGYKGEYTLVAESLINDDIKKKESVFVEIDGLLIPFFISSFRLTSDNSAILGFDDLETAEKADEFIGCKIYVSGPAKPNKEEDFSNQLTGYVMIDKKKGTIGAIEEILDLNHNLLFRIGKGNSEILIPVVDEFIVNVNHKKREITVALPEGLLDINR